MTEGSGQAPLVAENARSSRVFAHVGLPNTELSCEAPSQLGFVSFNSLFGGAAPIAS
jgi:hypothetical protein